MMCIICRAERSSSPEHVIPRALGGSFVIHRVCHQCNNALGARNVDQGLVEHNTSVERRVALQLAGNRGKVPDPIGDAIRHPIDTGIPNVKVRLSREPEGYRVKVEPRADVTLTEGPPGRTKLDINLIIDADDDRAEMRLRSALRKSGIKDEANLRQICDEVLPQLELRHGPATIGVPVKKNEGGHYLGITKIAYEMAHYWLGDSWLDDPIAADMRRALGGDRTASGRFKIGDGTTIERPRITTDPATPFEKLPLGYDPARTNLITLYRIDNTFSVCVYLLDAFSAMFLVTENAAAYERPKYDAVGMDVGLRRYEEFQTVMPALSRGVLSGLEGREA
jgi:hypothetical protein